jgi:hypothetical protein
VICPVKLSDRSGYFAVRRLLHGIIHIFRSLRALYGHRNRAATLQRSAILDRQFFALDGLEILAVGEVRRFPFARNNVTGENLREGLVLGFDRVVDRYGRQLGKGLIGRQLLKRWFQSIRYLNPAHSATA